MRDLQCNETPLGERTTIELQFAGIAPKGLKMLRKHHKLTQGDKTGNFDVFLLLFLTPK